LALCFSPAGKTSIIFEKLHTIYFCEPLGDGIRDLDSLPTEPTSCDLKASSQSGDSSPTKRCLRVLPFCGSILALLTADMSTGNSVGPPGPPDHSKQDRLNEEEFGHPRGTLAIVIVFGSLFLLGWLAMYVYMFLQRGAPHP